MAQQSQGKRSKHDFLKRDFGSINTQAARQSIDDSEFAWIENVIPIGPGHLKVVPAVSAALVDLGAGKVCYYMKPGNLANVDYLFMFCTDGSAYQIRLSNNAKTTVAAAATFSGSGTTAAQWKNERMLIIDANGYFSWDGSTLKAYNNEVSAVTITNPGQYTSVPAVSFWGPTGSGAAATAIVGLVGTVTIAGGGTLYQVGDILTVSGGTASVKAQIVVTTITVGTGAITGANVYTAGNYTAVPSNPVSCTGGLYGGGATFTLTFGVVQVNITNGGGGYTNGVDVYFAAGGSATATGTAAVYVVPPSGTLIEVYSGRVWVVSSGRTVSFSAPNAYSDFSTVTYGGSFIMNDNTLHSNIIQIAAANNYLYIFGVDSINVISNVQVNTATSTTVFTNTPVDTTVGTTNQNDVASFFRGVWFSNSYGIYALYGSTSTKASPQLDGIFQLIDFTKPISAGVAVIYSNLVLAFLVNYVDPVNGARPILLCYFDKKWFVASQGSGLTVISGSPVSGVPYLYGTDGRYLYSLFTNTSASATVSHELQTKLWDFGKPLQDKEVLKYALEVTLPVAAYTGTMTVDSEIATQATYQVAISNSIIWLDGVNPVTWQSSASMIPWLQAGYSRNYGDAQQFGKYIGATITSSTPGVDYNAVGLQYEEGADW